MLTLWHLPSRGFNVERSSRKEITWLGAPFKIIFSRLLLEVCKGIGATAVKI